ncbi:tetratricopeptide repeat protein [Hyphomicrobium sp.]|uniref:tetratricopeptide repeat protein n=1 Tax=Hyphomicrobium sp. TaxID=82 RepID=UPI002E3760F0|nr:tetratricopeptide repeat protein [Hyphomicrobium sp.]HEX2842142.1 tetratricopeptide repeat protein [Hyphomicrobium sp.]
MRILTLALVSCFALAGAANAESDTERLIKRAESGNVDAQVQLGLDYQTGIMRYSDGSGVERDFVKAKNWLEAASFQDYPPAFYLLGELYQSRKHNDIGEDAKPVIEIDHPRSARYYLQYVTLAEKLEPKADGKERKVLGDMLMKAMANLGDIYFRDCDDGAGWLATRIDGCGNQPGWSLPQDYAKAFHWYQSAAARGQYWAHYRLGKMYESGKGVPQDFKQAIEHYLKAAEGGYSASRSAIGRLHLAMGDKVAAYTWLNLTVSADDSDKALIQQRDEVLKSLTPEEIATSQERARAWFEAQKQ